MEPRTLQYRFQKYLAACNLSDVHFHTLRHTFATRCVEAGFEIKIAERNIGTCHYNDYIKSLCACLIRVKTRKYEQIIGNAIWGRYTMARKINFVKGKTLRK